MMNSTPRKTSPLAAAINMVMIDYFDMHLAAHMDTHAFVQDIARILRPDLFARVPKGSDYPQQVSACIYRALNTEPVIHARLRHLEWTRENLRACLSAHKQARRVPSESDDPVALGYRMALSSIDNISEQLKAKISRVRAELRSKASSSLARRKSKCQSPMDKQRLTTIPMAKLLKTNATTPVLYDDMRLFYNMVLNHYKNYDPETVRLRAPVLEWFREGKIRGVEHTDNERWWQAKANRFVQHDVACWDAFRTARDRWQAYKDAGGLTPQARAFMENTRSTLAEAQAFEAKQDLEEDTDMGFELEEHDDYEDDTSGINSIPHHESAFNHPDDMLFDNASGLSDINGLNMDSPSLLDPIQEVEVAYAPTPTPTLAPMPTMQAETTTAVPPKMATFTYGEAGLMNSPWCIADVLDNERYKDAIRVFVPDAPLDAHSPMAWAINLNNTHVICESNLHQFPALQERFNREWNDLGELTSVEKALLALQFVTMGAAGFPFRNPRTGFDYVGDSLKPSLAHWEGECLRAVDRYDLVLQFPANFFGRVNKRIAENGRLKAPSHAEFSNKDISDPAKVDTVWPVAQAYLMQFRWHFYVDTCYPMSAYITRLGYPDQAAVDNKVVDAASRKVLFAEVKPEILPYDNVSGQTHDAIMDRTDDYLHFIPASASRLESAFD